MTRPPAGRLFPPAVGFYLVVWLLLQFLFRERAFYDPGSLWHVRVGDLILQNGFMWADPFTFTFAGHTWIPQQWGAEVLMAVAHRLGGLDTLLLGFAAGVAALYAWVFARATRNGMGPLLAGVVVGGFLAAGVFHYFVRPHMATVALLAWTMAVIIDYDRGRVGLGRLAGLVPLFVVWTNLHGGVLGGILTLGMAVAWWWVRAIARRRFGWRTVALAAVVVGSVLTIYVNPFGLEMTRTWAKLVDSRVLKELVSEHMPLDRRKAPDQVMLALGAVYVVLLAGVLPRVRVVWLIPLAWFGLTFGSIRQGPLFAVTALVAVADFWPHTVWHRFLRTSGDTLVRDPDPADAPPAVGWRSAVVPAAVVLVALGLQIGHVAVPVVGAGWARLDPKFTPVDLNDGMTAYAASVPAGTPIFNDANLGGYLIYFHPRLKIFMDDRCELYGDAWISRYADVMAMEPDKLGPVFEGWQAEYGFDRAVVMTARGDEPTPPIERYLSGAADRWREVARGPAAVVFERVAAGRRP